MDVNCLGLYLSTHLAPGQGMVVSARPVEFQSRWQWFFDNPGPGIAILAVAVGIGLILRKTRE